MREMLTKSFWQGVKKVYYEALEGRPGQQPAAQPPPEDNVSQPSTPEEPPPQEPSREQP
ncbi:MAG TPA: hypothetical protein VN841_14415 [Bryobacteraceae bacterium]|nr:hypothetical protein [Bryobacteraceae bacterium]